MAKGPFGDLGSFGLPGGGVLKSIETGIRISRSIAAKRATQRLENEGYDPLTIEAGTPGQAGVRRASATVRVGPGGLWHTDYTQLTMAAQFPGEPPMASYAERLPIEEGTYLITLIHAPAYDPSFHVSVQVADPAAATAPVTEVPWFT